MLDACLTLCHEECMIGVDTACPIASAVLLGIRNSSCADECWRKGRSNMLRQNACLTLHVAVCSPGAGTTRCVLLMIAGGDDGDNSAHGGSLERLTSSLGLQAGGRHPRKHSCRCSMNWSPAVAKCLRELLVIWCQCPSGCKVVRKALPKAAFMHRLRSE